MVSIITSIIGAFVSSKVGQTKIPGFKQNVGEFMTTKTNNLASIVMTYGISVLAITPDDMWGKVCIIAALFAWTIRDSITKIK